MDKWFISGNQSSRTENNYFCDRQYEELASEEIFVFSHIFSLIFFSYKIKPLELKPHWKELMSGLIAALVFT